MSNRRPQFHGSLMGYNKTEVNDYLNQIESDLEEYEKKKDLWSEKVSTMELESISLNNKLAEKEDEKKKLLEEQKRQDDLILVLRAKIDSQEAVIERMKREYEALQKEYNDSESNPKRIQEAILSARDMGQQIVDKANKEADDILVQAESEKASKEEEGRMVVAAAKVQAEQVVSDAERKCVKLQNDYNRMLMDASGFKAELMNMYRRHMELLTAFPEKEVIAVDAVEVDVE